MGAGDGERPHLALAHMRQARQHEVEEHRHAAGDHVHDRQRIAAIGNVQHVDAGLDLEQFHREVVGRAVAGRGVTDVAGLRLRERDQLFKRLRREFRIDHHHHRNGAEQRHRREVLDRIEGQLGVERRRDRDRAWRQQQRVAVGRGLRHRIGAEIAAGAGLVLHHHRLAEALAEFSADKARERVGGAAGGERNHEGDRARGHQGCAERRHRGKQQRDSHEQRARSVVEA